MSLDFATWQRLDPPHLQALAKIYVTHHTFAEANSTSSTTFVDLSTVLPLTITKLFTPTSLRIDFYAFPWISVAGSTEAEFAVLINGVTYTICSAFRNEVNVRSLCSGVVKKAASLPAGTYGVYPRWRRSSGTGAINLDTASRLYMAVTEVR